MRPNKTPFSTFFAVEEVAWCESPFDEHGVRNKTGSHHKPDPRRPQKKIENGVNQGFTLIEILVVIVIVAIITAVAVMAFGHFGRGRNEKIIVEQFARVIPVAQQQAILTPVVMRLRLDARGYQFLEYHPRGIASASDRETQATSNVWKPLRRDVLSNRSAFKNNFKIDDDKNILSQNILFLPSGYVTPFVLILKGEHQFTMTVTNNGTVGVKYA